MTPFDDDVRNVAPPTTLGDFTAALGAVEQTLAVNEPVHHGRWRTQSVYAHVAHARAHLEVWMAERRREDLEHAATRCLMALALAERNETTNQN